MISSVYNIDKGQVVIRDPFLKADSSSSKPLNSEQLRKQNVLNFEA